ncbi:MAG: ABC transporter ATP-binding protein [Candidatus Nephthysia bennettiae]|uniref:ABC transporter ATP-binding protein n=1 Tax=Candidatus Nephthysia bennettiae TaxID=3127016 RepID=A0A934K2I3_9BACT|nr:ABC transporter ATP-binding protein [Candidatus Dormibacteraeota bacterium]MBJ7611905.1 ABC transporter ATP-binding protein [Candidatus Dormibacteraeota bacterium]PZR97923.1 MAG: ABC transporter ATP-binding protein [Candidatus Dormibacteraeota bacterium]
MTDAALSASHLHRFFHAGDEEVQALRDVSLRVHAGELMAVTGPSGSGKSTLVACLCGLDEPDGGTVTVAGERLSRRTESERAGLRARHIGLVLQAGNLIDHLTVDENLELSQRLAGRPEARRRAEVLERLGLASRASALPGRLSGGETARAGLALAVANRPTILVADEPTGEVDTDNEARVVDLLREEAARGTAVVVVTHSAALAGRADRILQLLDGRVAAE